MRIKEERLLSKKEILVYVDIISYGRKENGAERSANNL